MKLEERLLMAIGWLTEIAQVKDNRPVGVHAEKMPIEFWNGAIKGDYIVADKQWKMFCPAWHTAQAVKALIMAADILNKPELLEDAKFSAEFIMRNRITEGKDKGLILAFEDIPDKVNVSAVMECLESLFDLSVAVGENKYRQAATDALYWLKNNAYKSGKGLFKDIYDPVKKEFFFDGLWKERGRPLLEDAVFIKGWLLNGDEGFKQIAIDTAEVLLRDEKPEGNWIKYLPCDPVVGNIHPRQAYWWGMPMLDVFKATGDERFRECFFRSVEWYKKAMRRDGGFIRNTYDGDFNTDCFGHATSGTACAVISFLRYYEFTKDETIFEYIRRGLEFCVKVQFTNPVDSNMKGAILEKVLPPDGTDKSPYHIRDLGTIFFIQAASLYLKLIK